MELTTMGKVLVTAKLDNLNDVFEANQGRLTDDQVPPSRSQMHWWTPALLPYWCRSDSSLSWGCNRCAAGSRERLPALLQLQMYRAVRLTVQGRDCVCDVGEIPDEFPVIIGQIPLESLDWVIDTKGQRLIGNPEHGSQHMIDA